MTFTESKRYFIAGSAAALLGLTFQGCGDSNTSSLKAHVERCAKQNMVEDHLLCEHFYKCIGTSNLQKCRDDESCYDDLLEELEDEHCLHEPPAEAAWCMYPDSKVPAYTLRSAGPVDFFGFEIIEIGHRPSINSIQSAIEFATHLRSAKIKCDGFVEKGNLSGDASDEEHTLRSQVTNKYTFLKRTERFTGFKLEGKSVPGFKYVRIPRFGVEEQIDSATQLSICKEQMYPDGTSRPLESRDELSSSDDSNVDPAKPRQRKRNSKEHGAQSGGSGSGNQPTPGKPGKLSPGGPTTPKPKPRPAPQPFLRAGLQNTNQSCYIASTLQLMRTMDLIPHLEKVCPGDTHPEAPHNVCGELKKILAKMGSGAALSGDLRKQIEWARHSINPGGAITIYHKKKDVKKEKELHLFDKTGYQLFSGGDQNDPSEFFNELLRAIDMERIFEVPIDAREFNAAHFQSDKASREAIVPVKKRPWQANYFQEGGDGITLTENFTAEIKANRFSTSDQTWTVTASPFRIDAVTSSAERDESAAITAIAGTAKDLDTFFTEHLTLDGELRVNDQNFDYAHRLVVHQKDTCVSDQWSAIYEAPANPTDDSLRAFAQAHFEVKGSELRVKDAGLRIAGVPEYRRNALVWNPSSDAAVKDIEEFVQLHKSCASIRFRIDAESMDYKTSKPLRSEEHFKQMYDGQTQIRLKADAVTQERRESKITTMTDLQQAWDRHKCDTGSCNLIRENISISMSHGHFDDEIKQVFGEDCNQNPANPTFLVSSIQQKANGTIRRVTNMEQLETVWADSECKDNGCTIRVRPSSLTTLPKKFMNRKPFTYFAVRKKVCTVCGHETDEGEEVQMEDLAMIHPPLSKSQIDAAERKRVQAEQKAAERANKAKAKKLSAFVQLMAGSGPQYSEWNVQESFQRFLNDAGGQAGNMEFKCPHCNKDIPEEKDWKNVELHNSFVSFECQDTLVLNFLIFDSQGGTRYGQGLFNFQIPEEIDVQGTKYLLTGAQWQSGGMTGGHYTATVRRSMVEFADSINIQGTFGDAPWIFCDDSRIYGKQTADEWINPHQPTSSQAPYFVVYRRSDIVTSRAPASSP